MFLSLASGRGVRAVCLSEGGLVERMNAGRTVVDTSTVTSALARRGVDFCDTPVARMRLAAIDGTLINVMGGDAALVERLRTVLAHVVSAMTHYGHVGSGQVVKILNNMNLFQNVRALAEGLAIARRQGVASETFLEVLGRSSGDGFPLRNHGMKAIVTEFSPEGAFAGTYAFKDLDCALEPTAVADIDAAGADLVKGLFEEAVESGLGERYHPVTATLIDRRQTTCGQSFFGEAGDTLLNSVRDELSVLRFGRVPGSRAHAREFLPPQAQLPWPESTSSP